jgi:hypothetical protein
MTPIESRRSRAPTIINRLLEIARGIKNSDR